MPFFSWLKPNVVYFSPACAAVARDSASQRLRPRECLSRLDRRKFIIRRLTRIKYIDSFCGVHHFCRCAFQAGEWGCGSSQRAPLLGSFPLTHTSTRTDYSERRRALHTERIQCRRLCSVPSAERYCACLLATPPPPFLSTSDGPVISRFSPSP